MVNIIKRKNGEISILMALFILVLCIMLSGMMDLASRQWGLRETQTKIDIAGTNALYRSIDLNSLKDETLQIIGGGDGISSDGTGSSSVNSSEVESIIRKAYKEELSTIQYGGNYPTIKYSKVKFEYTNKGLGYKGSNASKERPQVSLESVVSYKIATSSVIDNFTGNKDKTFSSSFSNSEFKVTINENANDGTSELLIHSTTRIVLK